MSEEINHAEREHAELSMSSLARGIKCAYSVPMTRDLPRTSNEAADRGTYMHECAEYVFLNGEYPEQAEGKAPLTDAEKEIVDLYVHYATDLKEKAFWLSLECRVKVNERCWGTADLLALVREDDKLILYVVDLKTGYVSVEADCYQLKGYALGSLKMVEGMADPDEIRTVIVQPKDYPPIKEHSYHPDEVWPLEDEIDNALASADSDNPYWAVGEHCRWCPLAPTCPKMNAHLKSAFEDETIDLGDALHLAGIAENWAKRVRASAEEALSKGETISGWKLVQGRSIRKWKDESAYPALEVLLREEAFEKKYISPTQAEKLVGKAAFADSVLNDLVIKPEGKISLAPASDRRPAVNGTSVEEMFENIA